MIILMFVSYIFFILSVHHLYDYLFIRKVYLLRGIAGSGKSTFISNNEDEYDSYNRFKFYELNIYKFLKEKEKITSKDIVKAYNSCLKYYLYALQLKYNHIYITNPLIENWEYENYKILAKEYGYKVIIKDFVCDNEEDLKKCFDRTNSGINYNLIKNQYDNFESDENAEIIHIE